MLIDRPSNQEDAQAITSSGPIKMHHAIDQEIVSVSLIENHVRQCGQSQRSIGVSHG